MSVVKHSIKHSIKYSVSQHPRFTALAAKAGDLLSLNNICRSILFGKLSQIRDAHLIIESPDYKTMTFGAPNSELSAKVTINRKSAFSRIVLGGSVGAGESYIDRDWDTDNLVQLVRIFVRNRDVLNSMDFQWSNLTSPVQKFFHTKKSNTVKNSRHNIAAHYDLGNDFFDLFLDESKMYSSGYFLNDTSTLQESQFEKNDRLCRNLKLNAGESLLEIGTGWGGFAIHAAKHYGVFVTTTTISKNQYDTALKRIQDEGLQNRVTLLFEDYRNLKGQYDKLVSIEMIEAVGLDHLPTYFKKCCSLLKPDGLMALQSILIKDQYFDMAAKSVDFIQTHVFPGSAIPSQSKILEMVKKHTSLYQVQFENFGNHYAKTIHLWSKNLKENQAKIGQMGYPESLYRLWDYYFAYCEGGFLEESISVGHFTFKKLK